MARRTQSERDRSLADLVTHRYCDVATMRSPRVEKWDDSYDAHDPGYIDKAKNRSVAQVKFPYLHRVTTQQTTVLMEQMDANGRWLVAQPATKGNHQHAEAVTQFLENQYRQKCADFHLNNRAALKRMATMGLKYGNSYALCEWEYRPDWWGVKITSLDPYDVYADPVHGRFYILRRVIPLYRLKLIAQELSSPRTRNVTAADGTSVQVELEPRDGGLAIRAFRKIEKEIRENGTQSGYVYSDTHGVHGNSRRFRSRLTDSTGSDTVDMSVSGKDDPFNAPVAILEYYETDQDGMLAKIVPGFGDAGESLVLQAEENPYGACPIVPFTPYPVDNEFYGLGNYEIVGKLADAMDYNLNAFLDMIAALAWPPILYRRGAQLRKQFLGSIYGAAIETQDPDRDMRAFQFPSLGGAHQLGMQVAQYAADFGLGEGPVGRGDVSEAKSATAAAVAEAAITLMSKWAGSQWKDSMEQIGYVMLSIAAVHMSRTESIPILGRNSDTFYELSPDVLRGGRWTVQFGGNLRGINSSQQIATHLNILQAGGATGQMDVREVIRELYVLAGEREPDRFLTVKDPVLPVSPEHEHEALFAYGQVPVLSPQEDLLDHWQKHGQALQHLASQGMQGDPRFRTLFTHFQQTAQILTMQMQAQPGMGGATAGGPQPMGPADGGRPGQPGVMNAATADMNRARNGSNQQAAGQAPGPTGSVPNRAVGSVMENRNG